MVAKLRSIPPIVRLGRVVVLLAALSATADAATYPTRPAVGAGLVCVSDSGLVCLDGGDLTVRWQALAGEHTLEPVIADGMVLVGGGTGLHAFHAASGEQRWHWRGKGLTFTPSVDRDTAYVADQEGRLLALDLATGAPRWQRELAGWSYPPAIVAGRLVTGGREGVVRALDPADGQTLWRRELQQELVYRPVAVDDMAVITTFDGRILALDAEGTTIWTARDPVASFSPVPAGDLLLFGGMDGRLRARHVDDGRLVWQVEATGPLALPARQHAPGSQAALVDADGNAIVVDMRSGEVVLRTPLPGKPVSAPLYRDAGGWVAFSRRGGTIARMDLSNQGAE